MPLFIFLRHAKPVQSWNVNIRSLYQLAASPFIFYSPSSSSSWKRMPRIHRTSQSSQGAIIERDYDLNVQKLNHHHHLHASWRTYNPLISNCKPDKHHHVLTPRTRDLYYTIYSAYVNRYDRCAHRHRLNYSLPSCLLCHLRRHKGTENKWLRPRSDASIR